MLLFDQFDVVASEFERLVAATPLTCLEEPTPCSEWTVRLLLNHVVTGTQWFAAAMQGAPPPDRSIDQVKDDPLAAFASRLSEFRAVIRRPGVLEGSYEHPLGKIAGETLVKMRGNEYTVHGWDLAQATGQVTKFPDDATLEYLELYRGLLSERRREAGSAFGVEFEVAPDATPIERLVAFFGRQPQA